MTILHACKNQQDNVRRVGSLITDKSLADSVTEHASHVLVLLRSNILPQLFLEDVQVAEGFLAQNTRLGCLISGSDEVPGWKVTTTHVSMEDFEQNLRNFWNIPFNHDGDDSFKE